MKKNSINVKVWMMEKGIKNKDIAKGYGVSESFAGRFLKGRGVSQGLTDYLVKQGCPREYFSSGRIANK